MKSGRIRCGACQRVLEAPDDRRVPTRGERAQLDAMPSGMARGRELYRLAKPGNLSSTGTTWKDKTGEWWNSWHCRCGRVYAIANEELAELRIAAQYDRGEDLFLGSAHLR